MIRTVLVLLSATKYHTVVISLICVANIYSPANTRRPMSRHDLFISRYKSFIYTAGISLIRIPPVGNGLGGGPVFHLDLLISDT